MYAIRSYYEGVGVVHEGVGAVEGGVEAGNVRHAGKGIDRGAHTGEVVRLMQRRERRQTREILHHLFGQAHRRGVADPAMHDTVANRDNFKPRKVGAEHLERCAQRNNFV